MRAGEAGRQARQTKGRGKLATINKPIDKLINKLLFVSFFLVLLLPSFSLPCSLTHLLRLSLLFLLK